MRCKILFIHFCFLHFDLILTCANILVYTYALNGLLLLTREGTLSGRFDPLWMRGCSVAVGLGGFGVLRRALHLRRELGRHGVRYG